ncbi:hypothetical protein ATANTOWER_001996 [Ataeniobius toweri]|uniref:Uncharacterized protein n=1 Tax=Ataeniobius toweri TaxID=208326 RepID=A0ABU7A0R2_9TELE|nr:hypothetical protein [Ataeniobius toweri]
MSGKTANFCIALLLYLTSAYAARKTLNSIIEVKICVPQPTNILELLRWFANIVNIDNYGTIRLTFDPNTDYGSHHYGNFENILDRSPSGYKYYTVGNIHKDSSKQLPPYVRSGSSGSIGWNRARIIFSATEYNGIWNIRQVYITQHYGTSIYNGTNYDPEHTYLITTNLLREFRGRSVAEIQQGATVSQRSNYGNTSTHLQGSYYSYQNTYIPQSYPRTTDQDNVLGNICLVLAVCFIVIVLIFLTNVNK